MHPKTPTTFSVQGAFLEFNHVNNLWKVAQWNSHEASLGTVSRTNGLHSARAYNKMFKVIKGISDIWQPWILKTAGSRAKLTKIWIGDT